MENIIRVASFIVDRINAGYKRRMTVENGMKCKIYMLGLSKTYVWPRDGWE